MIRTQGRGVVYGELWFDEEPGAPLPDILICRQRPQPWPGARCEEFVTLQLDMTQEEQQLFDAFGKDNRYKIRRANDKDACVATFIDAPAAHLNAFCEFYDSFAVVRDLPPAHRSALQEAAACGQLVLTHAQQADATLVWHAYIVSGDHARLLHTASHFRSQNKQLQAVIGRLNRWLHWQDIREFKRRGMRIYDMGGIFSKNASSATVGVNRFKEEFGGIQSRSYDCTVALTWKGRIYLTLLTWRDRLQSPKTKI